MGSSRIEALASGVVASLVLAGMLGWPVLSLSSAEAVSCFFHEPAKGAQLESLFGGKHP
jgi:hypothetical protein